MAIYGTNQKDTINAADGVTGESDIIFGLDGDDTIYGLGGDDIMHGGKGDDTFYGGAGYDEVDYIDSDKGVTVDLVKGSGSGGTADGDTYFSVENVTGSLYRDRLTGNGLDNTLRGLDGGDTLSGLDGPDVLDGGNGDDYLYGETQDDILYGRDNDDYLVGGAGADQLFGGNGLDSVSYWASPEGVTVSLISNLGLHGDAQGDTFDNIERIFGSQHDDHLYGDDNPNTIHGDVGNDVLKGVGGDDVLDGTFDDDTLIGGAGLDTLTGGGQADTFVWSYTSETGVQAATADRITDFNFADGDRISLSGIDADIYADGNQAFGTLDFTLNLPTPANSDVLPGEIRYYHVDGNTYIEMNTGDNPNVEGVIRIEGIVDPQASWFVL